MLNSRIRLLTAAVALAGGCLALGAKLMLVHGCGSDVPYLDEWDAIGRVLLIPQAHGELGAGNFMAAQNEHRIVLPRLIAYSLAVSNGQWDALLEMSVNAAIHAAFCAALILLARRFVAGVRFAAVSLATISLFVLSFAWENTLQGLQSQFYLLEWTALAMFLLCVGSRPLGGRWWAGWLVGAAGLGTMSSGFMAPAVVLILMLLGARQERRLVPRDMAASALLAALCVAGLLSVAHVPYHDILRAHSPWQWLSAAASALSWPALEWPVAFAVLQLPAVVLVARRLRAGRLGRDDGILAAIALWTWMQVAAIAYGRANEGMFRSPRYMDLYAVGSFANILALAVQWESGPRARAWGAVAAAWIALFAFGLSARTRLAQTDFLDDYPRRKALEVQHVRSFLATGELARLREAPPAELPYPKAGRLGALLSEPAIRALLPLSVRPAVALSADSGSAGFEPAPGLEPAPGPAGKAWIARAGPARFVSRPLPAETLPYLEVAVCGSSDLDASALRLESGADVEPDGHFALQGARWHVSDMAVPRGATVRLVVDVPPGDHWFAFAEPAELGGGSWLDRWLLRRARYLAGASGTLFGAALVSLLAADARQKKWW